ncbi:thiopurine S-methyltransferase-like isoform X2 [Acanthaster planci]|nr:thiopurine S-methyltransferase-like isoform X2 [Acanthaster planci]
MVVGVELSTLAIEAFFKENQVDFTTSHVEGLSDAELYKSEDDSIQIYKANFFDLNRDILGEFDCAWDRGAFVSLPREDQERYADPLGSVLKPKGRYLLEAVEYDQSKMNGPPFSTPLELIQQLFAVGWSIEPLEVKDGTDDRWRSKGLDVMILRTSLLTKK